MHATYVHLYVYICYTHFSVHTTCFLSFDFLLKGTARDWHGGRGNRKHGRIAQENLIEGGDRIAQARSATEIYDVRQGEGKLTERKEGDVKESVRMRERG